LTVKANSFSILQGDPLPTLTATITGFVNGDTPAVVTGAASLTTTATSASDAGSYPITVSAGTLTAANYMFTFVNGTLMVNTPPPPPVITSVAPAYLLATGQSASIVVNGVNLTPASQIQVNGSARQTDWRNNSQLMARLSGADLAAAGTLSITVVTPSPGG